VPAITHPERYGAVIAKGDEVQSWREMIARYPGATIRLLEGSDHALSDFDDHLPFVLEFLQLCDCRTWFPSSPGPPRASAWPPR
jgi:predicted esterase YcpF (UPF0227 family)